MQEKVLSLYFDKSRCEEYGIYLYDLPLIESANENYEESTIGGRLGTLITPSGTIPNIKITCIFGILNKNILSKMRDIKSWLQGNGELLFTETPDSYYEVLWINRNNLERELREFGTFSVEFICFPYEFAISGKKKYRVVNSTFYNSYSECMPEYIIKGEGVCTLSVNDNQMKANIGQNLIINTRLMESYRIDGTVQNTSVEGDYKMIRLKQGLNIISITDGFELEVIPHWGWKA